MEKWLVFLGGGEEDEGLHLAEYGTARYWCFPRLVMWQNLPKLGGEILFKQGLQGASLRTAQTQ